MADLPGRPAWEPEDRAERDGDEAAEEGGWGSPVPAEYGSLHALHPPTRKPDAGPPAGGLFSAWARGGTRTPVDHEADGPVPAGHPSRTEGERPGEQRAGSEPARLLRWPSDPAPAAHPGPGAAPAADPGPAPDRPGRAQAAAEAPTGVIPASRTAEPAPVRPVPDPAGRTDGLGEPGTAPRPDREWRTRPDLGSAPRTEAVPVVDASVAPPAPAPYPPAALPAEAGLADATLAGADMVAPVAPMGGPDRPVAPLRRPVRRPGRARTRMVLRHIDVGTVAKVSVLFWLLVLVVIVVAAVLLWVAADASGTLPSIDKSVRTLFSLRKFKLDPGAVAMYTAAAGVVIAVIGTLASILLASIYNLIADVVGGVRVELESFGRE